MKTKATLVAVLGSVFVFTAASHTAHAATPNTDVASAPGSALTIQPGDTLGKIATANGLSIQRLFDANPAMQDPDVIYAGQQLHIPAADEQFAPRALPGEATPAAIAPVAPATPAPKPAAAEIAPAPTASVASGSAWDSLAQCEAGGNWAANTGNGYYGGLQFSLATWQSLGGTGLPSQASREEQIARAETLRAHSGFSSWPACSAKLGL